MSTNKPAEFNFYLNTQGPRGRQGAQGPQGVSPTITIGQNNANSFTLVITDVNGTFETPNLKGNLVDVSDNGSYVRYQPSDGTLYTSDLDQATTSTVGGVRFATEENLIDDISSGVAISPSDLQDYLAAKLTAGDNISITKDDETGIVTISTTGGGSGGVSSYSDLTNKPSINDVTLVGNKSASDLGVQEKFTPVEPLRFQESIKSVYEGYTLLDSTFNWTSGATISVSSDYLSENTNRLNSYDVDAGIINEKYFFDMPINKDYFYYGHNHLVILGVKNEITKDFEPIFVLRSGALYRVTKMSLASNIVRMTLGVVGGSQGTTGPAATSFSLRLLTTGDAITGLAWGTPNNYYKTATFTGERLADLQRCNVARFRCIRGNGTSSDYAFPSNTKDTVWAVFSLKDFDRVIPTKDEISQYGQLIPIPSPETTLNLTFNEEVIPDPYTLPAATTTSLGGVKPDGTTITVTSDGTITSVGGGTGGTTDYTALTNKPQINSVELTGNKSLTDIGAQAITDNTLTTTAKTIVGAINELVTRIAALETQVTSLNTVIDGQTGGNADA